MEMERKRESREKHVREISCNTYSKIRHRRFVLCFKSFRQMRRGSSRSGSSCSEVKPDFLFIASRSSYSSSVNVISFTRPPGVMCAAVEVTAMRRNYFSSKGRGECKKIRTMQGRWVCLYVCVCVCVWRG